MRASHLILIVPDLEALVREAGDASGVASRIMNRGRHSAINSDFPQFSLLFPDDPPPGAAAISRHADLPAAEPGYWLRCDPVAMVPDLTRVWVGETRFDHLPEDAGQMLTAALHDFFADQDLEFHMPAPGRGYLRIDRAPDCRFRPPWVIAGQPLDHVLPEGAGAAYWRRLLSESQIMLHNLDALQTLPPLLRPTSLWFWGAGAEAEVPPPHARLKGMIGKDPLIRGLAEWLQVPHCPSSDRPDGGRWLIQWEADRARGAAENLAELEHRWLAPALSALKWGRMRKLTLASMTDHWSLGTLRAWIKLL